MEARLTTWDTVRDVTRSLGGGLGGEAKGDRSRIAKESDWTRKEGE
eukprot:COSAG02_NODE_22783_length_740_cov_1.090484_1_plen_45_part_10